MDNIYQFFTATQSVLLSLPWPSIYFHLKIFFVFIDIALIIVFIIVFFKALPLRPDLNFRFKKKRRKNLFDSFVFKKRWEEIILKIDEDLPGALSLAVIEADKLIDEFLKQRGIKGENFGERMKNIENEGLYSWNRLWSAHKMRNVLVHSHDFSPSPEELKESIKSYEEFLKEAKVL